MSEQNERERLLRSLDRIRAMAMRVGEHLAELQNTVRFDHRSPGARLRTENLEGEIAQIRRALAEFREQFDTEHAMR